jgi:hypothetical protein
MVPNPIGLALPHAEWRNCTACTHIGDFGSAKSTGDDVSKRTELGCQTGPSTVVLASKPASACLLRLAMGVANPPGVVVAAFFHPRRLEGPHWAILEPKSVPSVILDKSQSARSKQFSCLWDIGTVLGEYRVSKKSHGVLQTNGYLFSSPDGF